MNMRSRCPLWEGWFVYRSSTCRSLLSPSFRLSSALVLDRRLQLVQWVSHFGPPFEVVAVSVVGWRAVGPVRAQSRLVGRGRDVGSAQINGGGTFLLVRSHAEKMRGTSKKAHVRCAQKRTAACRVRVPDEGADKAHFVLDQSHHALHVVDCLKPSVKLLHKVGSVI